MKFIYTFIVALCLMPLCIFGQPGNSGCSVNITDFPANIPCGTPWTQNGLTLNISPNCYTESYGDSFFLGGLLEIDLSPLNGVSQIVIELSVCCHDGEALELHAGNTIVDSEYLEFPYSDSTQIYILDNPQNLAIDKLSILGIELNIASITIYYDCAPACDPKIQVESEQGDVYIDDPCYGAILTSPNGSCFRVKVNDNGFLVTEAVTCP